MAIILYDLVGKEDRRFSPTCWRVRMALAHKGLSFQSEPTRFTDIPKIGDGSFKTVPTLKDGQRWVTDSDAIARYLEETYADRPRLFEGEGGVALTGFVRHWAKAVIHPQLLSMIVEDIHDHLEDEEDKAYFKKTREARLGQSLRALQEGREGRLHSCSGPQRSGATSCAGRLERAEPGAAGSVGGRSPPQTRPT